MGISLVDDRIRRQVYNRIVERMHTLLHSGFKGTYEVAPDYFKENSESDEPALPHLRSVLAEADSDFVAKVEEVRVIQPGVYVKDDLVEIYDGTSWILKKFDSVDDTEVRAYDLFEMKKYFSAVKKAMSAILFRI